MTTAGIARVIAEDVPVAKDRAWTGREERLAEAVEALADLCAEVVTDVGVWLVQHRADTVTVTIPTATWDALRAVAAARRGA